MAFAQNLIAGVATRGAAVIGEEIGTLLATGPTKYASRFASTLGIKSGADPRFSKWTAPGIKATALRGLEAVGITSGRTAAEKIVPWALKTVAVAGVNTLIWGGAPNSTPQATIEGTNRGPMSASADKKQDKDIAKLEKEVASLKTLTNKIIQDQVKSMTKQAFQTNKDVNQDEISSALSKRLAVLE
jgi:hypothetical protein